MRVQEKEGSPYEKGARKGAKHPLLAKEQIAGKGYRWNWGSGTRLLLLGIRGGIVGLGFLLFGFCGVFGLVAMKLLLANAEVVIEALHIFRATFGKGRAGTYQNQAA